MGGYKNFKTPILPLSALTTVLAQVLYCMI